jgi:membrane-associated phospholipid phosphatase
MIDRGVDVVAAPDLARRQSFGARLVGGAAKLWARSNFNRRQTLAKIANRRLWRPATYPPVKWAAWLCYALTAIALVALALDQPVGYFGRRWPAELVEVADWLTEFGLSGFYLIPAALIGIAVNLTDWAKFTGRRLLVLYNWTCLSLFVLIGVGIPGLMVTFLKHFIGRARPTHFAEHGAFAFEPFTGSSSFASMPSGHSCTVGSVATILVLLFPSTRYVVIPLALAVGTSRIILFSHYPSDVIAGLALGSALALLTAFVFMRLGYIFRPGQAGLPVRRRAFGVFW